MNPVTTFPAPPVPGRPEVYYSRLAKAAEAEGDRHGFAAAKVGQYLALAGEPHLTWPERLKYYRHALSRHCNPPAWPDEETWLFYQGLADLVRREAGKVALKVASGEDDLYAVRHQLGQPRHRLEAEARFFFNALVPAEECPAWFNEADYASLKVLRDHWVVKPKPVATRA